MKMKLTKILASIGPSSENMLEKLVDAGMNAIRLNFSHDTHEAQKKKILAIREISKRRGIPIAVVADLQGPKHRIGDFIGGDKGKKYILKVGQKFILDSNPKLGDDKRVCLPDSDVMKALSVGARVLLNDGKMELIVRKKLKDSVETEVVRGDEIWDRRAFNIPNAEIDTPILTEKDKDDLLFALKCGVDWVAVSFVQKAEDIDFVREFITKNSREHIRIISKIERPQAVERLESIINTSDGVMIARGDLAVEMPYEKVPVIQRQIIRLCRQKNKPVIVATQMMDAMIENLFPTRAEVSDVATACYQKTDATMLSGETTMGKYPLETVQAMAKILEESEMDQIENDCSSESGEPCIEPESALAESIVDMAILNEAVAIVVFSGSGDTARELSARRSMIPIIAICKIELYANQLSISNGVVPIFDDKTVKGQKYENIASAYAKKYKFAKKGDNIIVITKGDLRDNFAHNSRIITVITVD